MSSMVKIRFSVLIVFSLATICFIKADQILLPKSPNGQVWVKQVPQFRIISTEIMGDPFKILDKIDLKLKRYTANAGLQIIKPLVIEFPDLDWQTQDKRPLNIYLPLPMERDFDQPKDDFLYLEFRDSNRVASIAFNGAYTLQNILPYFEKLKTWLKTTGNVIAGSPRLLLYHHRALRFDFMREAELQIPIR